MELYHLSDRYLCGSMTLTPRIPINSMTRKGYEDNRTPRVCFSPTVQKCLMAFSQKNNNKTFYVYVPEIDQRELGRRIRLYHPTITQVPDVTITDEVWVLDPIPVTRIATIRVGKAKKEFPYTYGDGKVASLYEWEYTVINQFREKGTLYHGL